MEQKQLLINTVILWVNSNTTKTAGVLTAKTELFCGKLLNTYHYVELIDFLETKYGIRFKPDDLSSENFATAEKIAAITSQYYLLLTRKTSIEFVRV